MLRLRLFAGHAGGGDGQHDRGGVHQQRDGLAEREGSIRNGAAVHPLDQGNDRVPGGRHGTAGERGIDGEFRRDRRGADSRSTSWWAWLVWGKIAQPDPALFGCPSMTEAAPHVGVEGVTVLWLCSKSARAKLKEIALVVLSSRRIVATTSVKTKLPSSARPGPFPGRASCGKASMRKPTTSFKPLVNDKV